MATSGLPYTTVESSIHRDLKPETFPNRLLRGRRLSRC
jgi:hypothetical protein